MFSVLYACLPFYFADSEPLQKLSLYTRDAFFKIRRISSDKPPAASHITVIAIDEESCEKLGQRWPWSRRVFADMLDELTRLGAKTVGLNISFMGLEDGDEETSRQMAEAMKRHGNVVVGTTFDRNGRLLKPNPIIAEAAARYGYLEKILDPDFKIRRSYLLRLYSRKRLAEMPGQPTTHFEASFPLQLVTAHTSKLPEDEPRFDRDTGLLTVGRPRNAIYLDEEGIYTINYLVGDADIKHVPAWRAAQGKLNEEEVKGRLVLVGLTSGLFSDKHPTPLGIQSGTMIQANEFLTILSGRMLHFVPDGVAFFIGWLVAVLVLSLYLFRRFWLGTLGYALAAVGLFLGCQALLAQDVVLEPFIVMLGPVLGMAAGLFANSLKLLIENRGLETKAIHDKLTGLYKYEYLRECLEEEWRRCKKGKLALSIVMTDLDRFKKINDSLGHEVGNEMIRRAASVIQASARRYDIVSRYGGDEFVILLWHTSLAEAKVYKQRLRTLYHDMAKTLTDPLLKDSSISIGIAAYDPAVDEKYPPDPQRLIEDADKDLFLDKEARRKPGEPTR